jgi:hypothetical protein
MNSDVLGHICKWIPERSSALGLLANVNTEFNTEFQEMSSEIRDAMEVDVLNQYVDSDLQDSGFMHSTGELGLAACGYNSETVFSEYMHAEEHFMVYIYRGEGSSLIISSEELGWDNFGFTTKKEWDAFAPWVGLSALVRLDSIAW